MQRKVKSRDIIMPSIVMDLINTMKNKLELELRKLQPSMLQLVSMMITKRQGSTATNDCAKMFIRLEGALKEMEDGLTKSIIYSTDRYDLDDQLSQLIENISSVRDEELDYFRKSLDHHGVANKDCKDLFGMLNGIINELKQFSNETGNDNFIKLFDLIKEQEAALKIKEQEAAAKAAAAVAVAVVVAKAAGAAAKAVGAGAAAAGAAAKAAGSAEALEAAPIANKKSRLPWRLSTNMLDSTDSPLTEPLLQKKAREDKAKQTPLASKAKKKSPVSWFSTEISDSTYSPGLREPLLGNRNAQ